MTAAYSCKRPATNQDKRPPDIRSPDKRPLDKKPLPQTSLRQKPLEQKATNVYDLRCVKSHNFIWQTYQKIKNTISKSSHRFKSTLILSQYTNSCMQYYTVSRKIAHFVPALHSTQKGCEAFLYFHCFMSNGINRGTNTRTTSIVQLFTNIVISKSVNNSGTSVHGHSDDQVL